MVWAEGVSALDYWAGLTGAPQLLPKKENLQGQRPHADSSLIHELMAHFLPGPRREVEMETEQSTAPT